MIAYLKGTLLEKQPPAMGLEVNGVGYELEAPMTTFYDLPDAGAEETIRVDAAFVRDRLSTIADDEDLRRYIL